MLAAQLIILGRLSLYILTSIGLYFTRQAQGITSQYMDLAPNTFDDAYVGCSEKMEKVAVNLLKEEMARHTRLRGAWETAEKYWEQKSPGLSLPPGFKREHGIAIVLYTNSSNTLYRELNQAVRTGGRSWESYMNQFPFKALHFYLTRALQLLRGSGGCSSKPGLVVFRGVPNVLLEPRRLWDPDRLGQFASSTLDEAVAHKVYPNTIFFLRTCFGALIQDFSVFPEEREVLIPPQEILVTQFDQSKDQNWVTLSSSDHICSYFNCTYLGEKKMQTCLRLLRGQGDSLSKGAFSLFSWKTLLLASWGFQHLGAGL